MSRTIPSHPPTAMSGRPARRGSMLFMALFVVIMVSSILTLASDRVVGARAMQSNDQAVLQATYAAEAVAAQHEYDIVNLAATNNLVALDSQPSPNYGTQWFGDCLVRWRVEPVRVDTVPGGGSNYTVNPMASVQVPPSDPLYIPNQEFYTYRIATEAFALTDTNSTAGLASPTDPNAPWNNPKARQARVQATRVMAIDLNSLLKYAIFYAAPSPVGDLEIWVGTSMAVQGAVHSNGSIYIGGGGNGYQSGAYHDAASYNGPVSIGSSATPVTVDGVTGIYRLRKGDNFAAAAAGVPGASTQPMLIPLDGVGGMTGQDNLNGDTPSSNEHSFNGIAFNSSDDSRSSTWVSANAFGKYVTDQQNGARTVNTLSNIPALAGRPFEPQMIVPDGTFLYSKDGSNGATNVTIHPINGVSKQLFYDPTNTPTTVAVNLDGSARAPIYASAMPLFKVAPNTYDVHTSVTGGELDPMTGFPTDAENGIYYNWAMNGSDGVTTGLTIRERGLQYTGTYASGAMATEPQRSGFGTFSGYANAYALYMMSNYAVYLGGVDITQPFFNPASAITTGNINQLNAHDDQFVDRRQAYWYWQHGYTGVSGSSITSGANSGSSGAASFKIDALTLNVGNICTFLKTTSWSSLNGGSGSGLANAKFDGCIYAARTPRFSAGAYDPLSPWVYNPVSNPVPTAPAPFNAVSPFWYSLDGTPVGVGNWVVPMANKAIRIANGSAINYGITVPTAANRLKGLTIETPDQAYMWGDYNTVEYADGNGVLQRTPCALFSDGVTALSNSWLDSQNQSYDNSIRNGSSTTYILSLVLNNVPTTAANWQYQGSGGVPNVVKFLEYWNGNGFNFTGSLVCMNQQRYGLGDLGAGQPANFYSPPARNLTFNTDLLTSAGQPPRSPFGVNVVRAIDTIQVLQ